MVRFSPVRTLRNKEGPAAPAEENHRPRNETLPANTSWPKNQSGMEHLGQDGFGAAGVGGDQTDA